MKQHVLAFSLATLITGISYAEDDAANVAPMLVLKMYELGELVEPVPQFPFNPSLPTSGENSSLAGVIGFGGGSVGGGGQGGGGQGGGGLGYFSLPANVQFGGAGGGGFGGRQAGGGFGGVGETAVHQFSVQNSYDQHESLIELLTSHIDSDSWEANGGAASIAAVNNTLVIRQTILNHDAIAEFLKLLTAKTVGGQPLNIELWWLPLNAGARRNLAKALSGKDAATALNELCESSGGYHGTVSGRNRQTSNVCNGHRIPLVTGQVPVVAGTAVGYQPIMTHLNIGIFAELTPRMDDDWEGQKLRLSLRTAITTMNDDNDAAGESGEIDRFRLGNQLLETNAVLEFANPTVVGSLSTIGLFPNSDENQEMVVVVMATK